MNFAKSPMLQELKRLCGAGKSGTLFAALVDGHQLRIGLLNGRVMHVSSLALRGLSALETLSQRSPKSFRFSEFGLTPERHADLPSTPAILAFLDQEFSGISTETPDGGTAPMDTATLAVVVEELTEYVGPMAEILVKEAMPETRALNDLLSKLSRRLDSTEEMDLFITRIRRRLS